MKFSHIILYILPSCILSTTAIADGPVVDKIYHPYVLPLEQEVEWRFTANERRDSFNNENRTLSQRLGYGQSLSENITYEFYLIGERKHDVEFDLQAYELEVRWMITPQGKYTIDWGMIFELEKAHQIDSWEAKTGILAETELGKASLTANLFAVYEYGDSIKNDWDSEMTLQYRYRWKPSFQPAVELYSGENFLGIGPAFMGVHRIEKKKQLKYEAGLIFGLDNDSSNNTFRIAIEYEF